MTWNLRRSAPAGQSRTFDNGRVDITFTVSP